jgi:hypothetical protein
MWYINRKNKPVQIANVLPRNLSRGGRIPWIKGIRDEDRNDDTINGLLEVGSIVVPRPVIERGYMDDYPHKMTQKKITDKKKLVGCIVMPDEWIIPKRDANKLTAFLKKKGITLPIPDDF